MTSSDIPDTQLRTNPVIPNTKIYSGDQYYSLYIISAKERILLDDLKYVSVLVELNYNG